MNRLTKRFIALVVAIATVLSASFCMPTGVFAASTTDTGFSKTGTVISYDNSSNLVINRLTRTNTTSMGAANTWTIFVYMCGSDLEGGDENDPSGGAATNDINEMLKASTGAIAAAKAASAKVQFVIETGGSKNWQNGYDTVIPKDKLGRFVIDYSTGEAKLQKVAELNNANMGLSSTLEDFIRWGVTNPNYKADKMGFIFWDHGGGSIVGACNDENYNADCLTLAEIDQAFRNTYNNMTDKFEFIGFDTCLMGTLETANMLTPYARYMYGSEEKEPGCGWHYTSIADTLLNNPGCTARELGKVVCKSFYEGCVAIGDYAIATLACFDLSKTDEFITALNDYFTFVRNCSDKNILKKVASAGHSADNFGGNNATSGYVNMIDVMDFVKKISSTTTDSTITASTTDVTNAYNLNFDSLRT